MAIKYYCDGCGDDTPHNQVNAVSLRMGANDTAIHVGEHDLCPKCFNWLVSVIDPRNWHQRLDYGR